MPRPIDSLPVFYAHALAIEHEAAERYEEFTVYFRDRGEEVLAGLCASLARHESAHHAKLTQASSGMNLPRIDPTRYQWLESGSPEAPARELVYRVTTPRQLLEIALAGELAGRRFFRWVVRTSRDPRVRAEARNMCHEENEHVRWVMDALQSRESGLDWEQMIAAGTTPGSFTPG